jgi:hypothetical protein
MNLHDWIDELCDVLDIDVEVDEALVLDLARLSAHQVQRTAAPITTYLLGYAAGATGADPAEVESLAARATALAEQWEKPAGFHDPVEDDVEVPDDRGVDHSADVADLIS